jgi:hypothetical protein
MRVFADFAATEVVWPTPDLPARPRSCARCPARRGSRDREQSRSERARPRSPLRSKRRGSPFSPTKTVLPQVPSPQSPVVPPKWPQRRSLRLSLATATQLSRASTSCYSARPLPTAPRRESAATRYGSSEPDGPHAEVLALRQVLNRELRFESPRRGDRTQVFNPLHQHASKVPVFTR